MKMAVLGPKGTYSDIAATQYLKDNNLDIELEYYPSMLKVAKAIDDNIMGILPIENTLDGFVIESMDQLILNKFHIIKQIKLDIDFAFVTNAKSIEDVKICYVQFKAQGQCVDFLCDKKFKILSTQSNMESYELALNNGDEVAAIIPMHALKDNEFKTTVLHVADSNQNQTRFFIITKNNEYVELNGNIEASIVITSKIDRPGILFDILKEFHVLDINLKSIMSRPMKTEMGKYRFYLECSLSYNNIDKLNKLKSTFENQDSFIVDVLGIYNSL